MVDNKEYARQLRTNAAKDENGVIRCSPELWEEIARIIENSEKVKHARWIQCSALFNPYCSDCNTYNDRQTTFCPCCGAKMDGRKDDK